MTPTGPARARLSRSAVPGLPAAPVRALHVGLGNFFRAHQAWYTDRAPDAAEWGIAGYTGRSSAQADALRPQDGLYTLVTRSSEGDRFDVVGSLSSVHAAREHDSWRRHWAAPELALVTLTVTEAGFARAPDGRLDVGREDVSADAEALRGDITAPVRSLPGRMVSGYLARRAASSGPVAVVPCDNIPHNGEVLRAVVGEFASLVDPSLPQWIDEQVSYVTTMVDRITPATTEELVAEVGAATGLLDRAPVATEPFSEWVLQGSFPAGRPAWEDAGARLVEDVTPFEQRKLRLLNGAHSLLAYAGSALGHRTVADAIADPACRAWVDAWWDEACRHLSLGEDELAAYRSDLIRRFGNTAIEHLLAQIAMDGSQKIPIRIVPTLRAERAAGRSAEGAAQAVAAWISHLRGLGAPVRDVRAAELVPSASGPVDAAATAILSFLDRDLAGDAGLRAAVVAGVRDLEARAAAR